MLPTAGPEPEVEDGLVDDDEHPFKQNVVNTAIKERKRKLLCIIKKEKVMSIKHSISSFLFNHLCLYLSLTPNSNFILSGVFKIDKNNRAIITRVVNNRNAAFHLLLKRGEKDGMKRYDIYFPVLCVVPMACINELQIGRKVANVRGASGTPVKLLISFESAS